MALVSNTIEKTHQKCTKLSIKEGIVVAISSNGRSKISNNTVVEDWNKYANIARLT